MTISAFEFWLARSHQLIFARLSASPVRFLYLFSLTSRESIAHAQRTARIRIMIHGTERGRVCESPTPQRQEFTSSTKSARKEFSSSGTTSRRKLKDIVATRRKCLSRPMRRTTRISANCWSALAWLPAATQKQNVGSAKLTTTFATRKS